MSDPSMLPTLIVIMHRNKQVKQILSFEERTVLQVETDWYTDKGVQCGGWNGKGRMLRLSWGVHKQGSGEFFGSTLLRRM